MRTVVMSAPAYDDRPDRQVLVTLYDDGQVTVAERGDRYGSWGPPWTVEVDEGTVASPIFAYVKSWGLIPELYTFDTEAEAEAAWRSEVTELWDQHDGWACDGDDPCGGGDCEREDHTLEELIDSGFVTDWNKVELRKEW